MTNFIYTTGIPNAPNNPSTDQPNMKTNTNSIDGILKIDHYGFNDNNGGLHKQVRLPILGSIPTGLVSGEGTIYTKTTSGVSEEFYSPDNSANQYQMTRTISASFTKFSTNTAYGAPPAGFTQTGGWTFLPGGMLMQYGFYGKSAALGSSGTIQFPVTFTNVPYSIQITLYRNAGNQSVVVDSTTPATTSSFKFSTIATNSDGIYWVAIGV